MGGGGGYVGGGVSVCLSVPRKGGSWGGRGGGGDVHN